MYGDFKFVGFWRRVGASFLDAVFIIPFVIVYMLTYKYFISNRMIVPFIIYYIIVYGYQVFFNVRYGGTPAKLILNYRIIDDKGEFISLLKAILRISLYIPTIVIFLLKNFAFQGDLPQAINIVDNILPFIVLLDPLLVVFNSRKRALHDFIANSYVVTKESWLEFKKTL